MEDPRLWSSEGGGADPTLRGPKATPTLLFLPCTWLPLTPPSGKSQGGGGLFWASGRYHDLSRLCCLLPRCCQGDAMNFDLKRSWLGATLVQQGRGFFFFSVLVCVGGCTEVGSWLWPQWPVRFSGATYMNSLADLYVYLDNGGKRKVAMECRVNYSGFFCCSRVWYASGTLDFPVLSK